MYKKVNTEKILAVIFVLSIIPILIGGFYARPLWDDFNSSWVVKKTLGESGIFYALSAAISQAAEMYYSWQGTYSAEFLFALQPGIFSASAYWLTTFIIVGSISFSYIFFFTKLSELVLKCDSRYGKMIALILLAMQFQYVPYMHQGFYWYNGAIYYSFFMALLLMEISFMIEVVFSENAVSVWKVLLTSLLAFFISGGNYSTALIQCVIGVLFLGLAYYKKDKIRRRQMLIICVFAFVGFFISVIAPGNQVRAQQTQSIGAIPAILRSIKFALARGKWWIRIPQIGMVIGLLPVINRMLKKTSFKFRYPGIVVGVLFGLYSAQMTPPIYAMGYAGAERQMDMYYYGMYLLIAGSLIYFYGWIISKNEKISLWVSKYTKRIVLCGMMVLALGLVVGGGFKKLNSYKVASDIVKGRAAEYDRQYEEIVNSIKSQEGTCYIDDIKQWTNSYEAFEISDDSDEWVNNAMALYFEKDKIALKQ